MGSGVDSVPSSSSSSSSVVLAPAPGATPSPQALFSIPEIPSAPVQDDLDLSQLDPRLHPIASLPPRTPPSQPIVPAIPVLELYPHYPHSLPTSPRSRSDSAAPDEVAHQAEDDMDGWDDDVDLGEANREDAMAEDDNEDEEVQEQEAVVLEGNGGVIHEVSAGAKGLPVGPPSLPLDKGKGKEKPKEAPSSLSYQQKLANTSTGLTASARIKTFQDNARRLRNQVRRVFSSSSFLRLLEHLLTSQVLFLPLPPDRDLLQAFWSSCISLLLLQGHD
ncbi:hypothetical protein BDY24DRAFT_388973 [Mrakia frigida]|uniref:uncharacterized protein n=1 Tax=Mrakia frigida TaxID=29902 RepID=UPI003FCC1F77